MVITSEGLFQSYLIDMENGGECTLVKEFPWVSARSLGLEVVGRSLIVRSGRLITSDDGGNVLDS
jgi:hypothetical protein